MKKILFFLFGVSFFFIASKSLASEEKTLPWVGDFALAKKEALKESKPLFLLFTGSDWCPWCKKMEEEILKDPEFIHAVKDLFVFVTIDFPSHKSFSPEILKRNKKLKEEYKVVGFPTLVLVDVKKGVISKLGYFAGGGAKYAAHLKEILLDYHRLQAVLENQEKKKRDVEEAYHKAKELGSNFFVQKLLEKGLQEDEGTFFLLEKYDLLVQEHQENSCEGEKIRKEIEMRDPQNILLSHLHLALVDFQTLERLSVEPEKTIEPLVRYITLFGKRDKENRWKVQKILSFFLFHKGKQELALQYARDSYKSAPLSSREEVASSISYFKKEIEKASAKTL